VLIKNDEMKKSALNKSKKLVKKLKKKLSILSKDSCEDKSVSQNNTWKKTYCHNGGKNPS